jgi:hypothetical protein
MRDNIRKISNSFLQRLELVSNEDDLESEYLPSYPEYKFPPSEHSQIDSSVNDSVAQEDRFYDVHIGNRLNF